MKRNTRSTSKKDAITTMTSDDNHHDSNATPNNNNNNETSSTTSNTSYTRSGRLVLQQEQEQEQHKSNIVVKDHYVLPLSMRLLRALHGGCSNCSRCSSNIDSNSNNVYNSSIANELPASSNDDGDDAIVQPPLEGSSLVNTKALNYSSTMSNVLQDYKQEQEVLQEMYRFSFQRATPNGNNSSGIRIDPLFCSPIQADENTEEIFDATNNIDTNQNGVHDKDNINKTISTVLQRNQQQYMIEHIIHEYHMICTHLYHCNIDMGIIATIRYTIPTLRLTNSNCTDAHIIALCEILYKYGNGPLSYILYYDLSRLRKHRNFNNHHMNLFQHDTSPFHIVSSSPVSTTTQSAIGGGGTTSGSGFGSYGAIALAKWVQQSLYMKELYLDRNPIGPYGAYVLFQACSQNRVLEKLSLRRCHIKEDGAIHFVQFIILTKQQQIVSLLENNHRSNELPATLTSTNNNKHKKNALHCSLQMVDLSANRIGYRGSVAIEVAMNAYHKSYCLLQQHVQQQQQKKQAIVIEPILIIDMEGNLALQEVMNSITHGLGIVLAFIGTMIMMNRVLFTFNEDAITTTRSMSIRHICSCAIYSVSLIVLYTSSTLYHSFFTLRHTKWVFEVIDKCAIYILIAGSYTPFLQIVLAHHTLYSYGLLCFLWSLCFVGVMVEFMYPTWKYKGRFSLFMFLCMGWSALICLPEVARIIPPRAIHLMTMGGISYTAGVPFFVRNNNLDHAVWHLFVLAGSIFHWCGVYLYVIPLPIQ